MNRSFFVARHTHITDMMTFLIYSVIIGGSMLTCTKCKTLLPKALFSKDKARKTGFRAACKECSALEFKKFRDSPAYLQRLARQKQTRATEKKELPRVRWAKIAFGNAKRRAKQAGLDFTLTVQGIINMAQLRCPLLDVQLDYGANVSNANSASIDRIDSRRGYTSDNCKVISFKANRIKTNATLEEITLLAKNMQSYKGT